MEGDSGLHESNYYKSRRPDRSVASYVLLLSLKSYLLSLMSDNLKVKSKHGGPDGSVASLVAGHQAWQ